MDKTSNIYKCSSCGAELLMDETDAHTNCVYCGSTQLMKEKLDEMYLPSGIVPFKNDKNSAIEEVKRFIAKSPSFPKSFKLHYQIVSCEAIYVPYSVYTFACDFYQKSTLSTSAYDYKDGIRRYTYYHLERKLQEKMIVPQEESKNMPDNLLAAVEPFDYSKMVEFHPTYLSGVYADTTSKCIADYKKDFKINDTILFFIGYMSIFLQFYPLVFAIIKYIRGQNATAIVMAIHFLYFIAFGVYSIY